MMTDQAKNDDLPSLVSGIGGVFFRARNPEALNAWYRDTLGIVSGGGGPPWHQDAGYTVFAPFKADTDYFGNPDKQWMINFRVTDLDALLAHLRTKGIEVLTDPEWDVPEIGRFARIHDPEGNPIELWEPAANHVD